MSAGQLSPPVSPARQDAHNSYIISSGLKNMLRLWQNLATPWALGRELAGASDPPVCRKWVQILRSRQSPAQTLPMGWESGSAHAAPGTGTKSCLPRAPLLLLLLLLCVCSLSSPSPMAAPAQDLPFPDSCFSLPLDEATKHSKHSTLQASPRPHLQLEWPLFWLPTNTVYLIPWVLLVSSVIDPAFPC